MSTKNLSRRQWMRGGVAAVAAMAAPRRQCRGGGRAAERDSAAGAQRLSVERLKSWEALGYGMFIHFGMSTFDGKELSDGRAPATLYAPDALDVDQWVSVARDAGMKYAVLTAKHVAGHCLWPSRHTAYTVANSTDKTDVCERFVNACAEEGRAAGLLLLLLGQPQPLRQPHAVGRGRHLGQLGRRPGRGPADGGLHHVGLPELPDPAAHRAAHAVRRRSRRRGSTSLACWGPATASSSTATSRGCSPRPWS